MWSSMPRWDFIWSLITLTVMAGLLTSCSPKMTTRLKFASSWCNVCSVCVVCPRTWLYLAAKMCLEPIAIIIIDTHSIVTCRKKINVRLHKTVLIIKCHTVANFWLVMLLNNTVPSSEDFFCHRPQSEVHFYRNLFQLYTQIQIQLMFFSRISLQNQLIALQSH
jgi:hypothetical protein